MTHEFYMQRCIQLAQNGLGSTYPNPMVGSVIVHNGRIIGEGWHQKAGNPHAEVRAIESVKDKSLLKQSTIYINLEPCSHYGKTPPCCDLILAHNIPEIVVGNIDPFDKVAGNGIKRLKDAGKKVTIGVLEKECEALNKRFFTFHLKKRPYIILKWAQTADGFIAPSTRKEKSPVWISNDFSKQWVHKWRSEEQALLAGTKTILDDNPLLNTRDWKGKSPLRVVLDKNHSIPDNFHVKDGKIPTLILTEDSELPIKNSDISYEKLIFDSTLVTQIIEVLYQRGIQSIIIEGGTQTLQTFIDKDLWDEARIFKGIHFYGTGIKAPRFPFTSQQKSTLTGDTLEYFYHD